MDNENLLSRLNRFTRREFTAEEVYIFPVILCDNEIDRDHERFSDKSLAALAEKFIGVTGIFDHNPKGENQTARLFAAELITEKESNSLGEPYAYLRGYAYMIRTDSNADLIREIDGGIKKEVSVSCSAERQICSVCGADRRRQACRHVKGKEYGGKRCYFTLEDISDAYEWSFVAVPAQIRAGVTKSMENDKHTEHAEKFCREEAVAKIRRSIIARNQNAYALKFFDVLAADVCDDTLRECAGFVQETCHAEDCGDYKM